MITSLPDDIIVDILARVLRCDYPMVSLVSKHFQSLVASSELYARRSLLGCTEACLYAFLHDKKTRESRLYILRRKDNDNNRLVLIPSLRVIHFSASFVSVGSKICVFEKYTSVVLKIDCRSHKVQSLSSIPMHLTTMDNFVAAYMNRKIYVIGYCKGNVNKKKHMINVFNTETQMWEPEITELDMELGYLGYGFVVMEDRIYIRDQYNSFVYRPKENKWETDEMLNSKDWRNACAIDDLLCYYDYFEKELRVYDTKQRLWRVVKGVAELFPEANYLKACTVSCGGKLAVFLCGYDISSNTRKIWCAEIGIERRGGEIWGKVEWCDVVIEGNMFLLESLAVIV